MITTICLNPSFDKTVTVDSLVPGRVNRIRTVRTDAGGKGVNVAVVARRLGLDAQVLACAGVDGSGLLRTAMNREGVGHAFLTVEGSVRVNTKVVALDGAGVTELNEPGPTLTAEDLDNFFDLAIEKTKGSDYVVMTGSLPPGCPERTYRDLIRTLKDVPCILDATGEALHLGAEAAPFLIKPNHHELGDVLGRRLRTVEEVKDAAQLYVDSGVKHVIVSMGSMGAVYVGQEGVFFAPAISVEVRSTVGAGDAMLGGLVHGLMTYGNLRDAFRCGVAAGAASVMTEGTQLVRPADYQNLLPLVQIRDI